MKQEQHRYLVITELFLPTKGGTAVWFDEVYQRIGGREIHIVTADVEGGPEYDKDHTNTVHRVSLKRHWWLRPESLGMYVKLFSKAVGIAFTQKIDAVHAGRVLPEGLVGLVVARLSRKPLVIYAHGEEITTWRQPGKFKVMSYVYRHAHLVIANSQFTKNELLKLGVVENRISLISPGVDVERFRPGLEIDDLHASINLPAQAKLILSVGRLSRRKGFDQVVKSLPQLIQCGLNVHYALIGIGEDEAYLKRLAEEHDVAQYIHFLGHVSAEDLPRWYNACDVFAMPNREINGDTEGFGMVFQEAAACGRLSLAGQAGGTGDAVREGVTGKRVDGESLEEVVNGLAGLLTSASDTPQKFDPSSNYDLSWEAIADKTRKLKYKNID